MPASASAADASCVFPEPLWPTSATFRMVAASYTFIWRGSLQARAGRADQANHMRHSRRVASCAACSAPDHGGLDDGRLKRVADALTQGGRGYRLDEREGQQLR